MAGNGRGFVDEFDVNGRLIAHVATRGSPDAPWGLAMTPASGFRKSNGSPLVSNFGDGHTNAYR